MIILLEFGRDPDGPSTNGFFNHRSFTPSGCSTWMLVLGEGVERPQIVERPVRHIDVCPTFARLLGCQAQDAQANGRGKPMFGQGHWRQKEVSRMQVTKKVPERVRSGKPSHQPVIRKAITAPQALNEAYNYAQPSSFSRGLRLDIRGIVILLISGTASVDEQGRTAHAGDFRAQLWRTYHNLTALLEAEDATWKDVVRTTCYLRDIERDYAAFNEIRTQFFQEQGLDPLPASTGVQTILCRSDLLIEMELMAVFESRSRPGRNGTE